MWAASHTIVVGDLHVGVSVSRSDVDEVVVAMFDGHLADGEQIDGQPAPRNFAVRIGGFDGEDPDPLHLLYRGKRAVVRSRRPSRILGGLAATLQALDETDRGDGTWPTRGMVLVGPAGRAVVVGSVLARQRAQLQPLLERRGVRIVDAPDPRIDLVGRTVVVPRPTWTLDAAAAEALDARFGAEDTDEGVAPGRYPLAGWLTRADGDLAGAARVGAVVEDFDPPGAGRAQELLDAVATLSAALPVRGVSLATPRAETVDVIAEALT